MAYGYNYNPNQYQYQYGVYPQYGQQVQVQPQSQFQSFQNVGSISGRTVNDFNEITANDVPMNGEPATFIKRDLSEIQVRMWNSNGQITMTSYKPYIDEKKSDVTNVSNEDIKTLSQGFNEFKEDILGRFDKLDRYFTKTNKKQEGGTNE